MKAKKTKSAYKQLRELMPWMVPPINDDAKEEESSGSCLGLILAILLAGLFMLFTSLGR